MGPVSEDGSEEVWLRSVVCDTGPILHLSEANALHLLEPAGRIVVPPAVHEELAGWMPSWPERKPDWLRLHDLNPQAATESRGLWEAGILDRGEADALALARQLHADWFLTDDAAARLLAEQLGLEAHGSLGVVLWAAATGRLDRHQADQSLKALFGSSLWVSSRVKQEALSSLGELFKS